MDFKVIFKDTFIDDLGRIVRSIAAVFSLSVFLLRDNALWRTSHISICDSAHVQDYYNSHQQRGEDRNQKNPQETVNEMMHHPNR